MLDILIPITLTIGGVLVSSVAIYFSIRYFAYKRSFPLPHQFDFLWIIATLLTLFLSCAVQPPLEGNINPKFLTWTTFISFLLFSYLLIFVVDQFLVEYFLVSFLKIYIAPPLRKVMVLFIFAVAIVVAVQKIFSINPWAVYAPTSLLTLGIGIALKDAFQTFFAGVALSRIVHIGDWIRINDKEGEVVDINWARTVLRSKEGAHFFIPNSELQNAMFVNFSFKEGIQRCQFEVGASYQAAPQKVKRVLLECALGVDAVLSSPPAEALLLNYADSSIQYALTFWIKDYSRQRELKSEVSTRIWYAFKRENIEIPFPMRTLHVVRKSRDESSPQEPETLLSHIDLFKMLSSDDKQRILECLQRQIYLKGEIVVREGEPGSSFYIVYRGKLEVFRKKKDGQPVVIGDLSAGQFFGELSLLTGEPRSATIRAVVDSELFRLEKEDFKEILERHPHLTESLAEIVTTRQSALSGMKDEPAARLPADQQKSTLSRKIREFFNLKERVG